MRDGSRAGAVGFQPGGQFPGVGSPGSIEGGLVAPPDPVDVCSGAEEQRGDVLMVTGAGGPEGSSDLLCVSSGIALKASPDPVDEPQGRSLVEVGVGAALNQTQPGPLPPESRRVGNGAEPAND